MLMVSLKDERGGVRCVCVGGVGCGGGGGRQGCGGSLSHAITILCLFRQALGLTVPVSS